ncbi:MAG: hypothetical protein Q8Q01_00275 [archaeon]|nr:hypothetical protein [archaeon]
MTPDNKDQYDDTELFRRFALFGVSTKGEHFDTQISRIEEICNVDGNVVMLELAPNYEQCVHEGLLKPNTYLKIADRWKERCSKIIAGDQELTIPENPDWLVSLVMGESYFYPDWNREEIMRANIVKEKPDIVIVGNGNSDLIKDHFPHAYYIVFEINGRYSASSTGHNRGIHRWHNPNKIITLPSREE